MSLVVVQRIIRDTKIWQKNMSGSKTKNKIDSKSGSKDSYLYYNEGSKSLWYFL
jgi:hypothetical protein